MLRINATNEFGSHQYVQDRYGDIMIADLDPNDFWSIKDPSDELIEYMDDYFQGGVRYYNDHRYLLSKKAYNNIPENTSSNGAVCILSFQDPDTAKQYFIVTGDNKSYLMNCGGGGLVGETFEETAVREVWEELHISLSLSLNQLEPIAEWSNTYYNELVETEFTYTTQCFYVELSYPSVSHLISEIDPSAAYQVFNVRDNKYPLDETEIVVIVDEEKLEKVPLVINKRSFNGIHRKLLYHLKGIPNDIDMPDVLWLEFL